MKPFFVVIIALLAAGCRDSGCCTALRYAGNNAPELKKVLDHYRGDSKKYEAACYLISNMPFHRSYDSSAYSCYSRKIDSLLKSDISDSLLIISVDSLKRTVKVPLVNDVEVISADYLINNIEQAFSLWKESPFLTHLSFDDFKEWVLPYKCLECQPISDWRTEFILERGPDSQLGKLSQITELANNASFSAGIANREIEKDFKASKEGLKGLDVLPLFDKQLLLDFPYENCIYRGTAGLLNCRANGIPVSMDFTPQWPDRHNRHYWNAVMSTNRYNFNYDPFNTFPGNFHHGDIKIAKVFRYSYAPHPVLKQAVMDGEIIPESLRQIFVKDVTAEYEPTIDLNLRVRQGCKDYAYLAVFDDFDWCAVDICRVKGRKVSFSNVGKGILYIVLSNVDGHMVPVSKPFIVDNTGEMDYFESDEEKLISIRVSRKYPSFKHIYKKRNVLQGGIVEASNNPDFSEVEMVVEFPEWNMLASELEFKTDKAFRYWRLKSSYGRSADFAELFLYDNRDSIVTGSLIDSGLFKCELPMDRPESLFDRNALTYISLHNSTDSERWVGLDLNTPVQISKIAYIRRGDGNDVIPGDEYELYYWKNGRWNLIGRQIAEHIYLDWDNVPSGALLYIKDISRGIQNRVFRFDRGKVEWL